MSQNASRPIIGANGVIGIIVGAALLLWIFRAVLLNDLGISTHGAHADEAHADETHAAAELVEVAAEEPVVEAEPAVTPEAVATAVVAALKESASAQMMPATAVQPQLASVTAAKPADYVEFNQASYGSLAVAGVNWQQSYVEPTAAAAPVVREVQVAMAEAAPEPAEEAPAAIVGDVKAGEKTFKKKCRTCHSNKEGDKHKTGPNLWGIVGYPGGKLDGYTKYSKDLKNWDGVWDVANLDLFLTKPKKMFKKTKMSFSGLKKEQDRADVIAYLDTLK